MEKVTDARVVDAWLREDAARRNAGDFELGRWLVLGDELQVERLFGYGSLREYGERVFGFSGRGVEDRVRVARALEELPGLSAVFSAGDAVYTAVRELVRVATAETEGAWLAAAEGKTSTQVRQLVSGRQRGDLPSDAAVPELVTRRVTLELSPEAYALLKEARSEAVKQAGASVDDSAFVTEAMLAFLSGGAGVERDAGRAAYQVALTVDAHGRAVVDAGGEAVPVDGTTVAMAKCDGQELGRVDVAGKAARATQTVPPRVRRQVVRRHGKTCAAPGCSHSSFVHVHHVDLRSEGGTHDPERLVPLCSAHHRAVHEGALHVRGCFSEGFEFVHADGTAYGSRSMNSAAAAASTTAFGMLTGMGFRDREARDLLDMSCTAVRAGADALELVRYALKAAPPPSRVREDVVSYRRCA